MTADDASGIRMVNGYFQAHEVYFWTAQPFSGDEVLARIRYVHDLLKRRFYWVSTDYINDTDDRKTAAEQHTYFLMGLNGMRESIANGDQGYSVLEHLLDDHF